LIYKWQNHFSGTQLLIALSLVDTLPAPLRPLADSAYVLAMSAKTGLVYTPAYEKKHQELVNIGYVNLRAWLPYVQEILGRVKAMESKELALKTPSNSPSKVYG
jgi:hypothetical protein